MKKEYGFLPSEEYIKDTMHLSAREKLIWLKEANEFIRKALTKKKRAIWEKFRRGEI